MKNHIGKLLAVLLCLLGMTVAASPGISQMKPKKATIPLKKKVKGTPTKPKVRRSSPAPAVTPSQPSRDVGGDAGDPHVDQCVALIDKSFARLNVRYWNSRGQCGLQFSTTKRPWTRKTVDLRKVESFTVSDESSIRFMCKAGEYCWKNHTKQKTNCYVSTFRRKKTVHANTYACLQLLQRRCPKSN